MNLKKVLMELGNALVARGFDPCGPGMGPDDIERPEKSTCLIAWLTDWLNQTPEAQEELKAMGVEWPVVPGKEA